MTQWMQFITLRPKIVLIDTESKAHVIRENETNAVFDKLENTPQYLKK
jgi:diaminopimelate decarboxylase